MTSVLKIEVDLFSGRPNPVLELRGSRARHLQNLLEQKRQQLHNGEAADPLASEGSLLSSKALVARLTG